jgi:hypothetical protein
MFMMVVKKLIVFPVTERGCHGAVMGRRGGYQERNCS